MEGLEEYGTADVDGFFMVDPDSPEGGSVAGGSSEDPSSNTLPLPAPETVPPGDGGWGGAQATQVPAAAVLDAHVAERNALVIQAVAEASFPFSSVRNEDFCNLCVWPIFKQWQQGVRVNVTVGGVRIPVVYKAGGPDLGQAEELMLTQFAPAVTGAVIIVSDDPAPTAEDAYTPHPVKPQRPIKPGGVDRRIPPFIVTDEGGTQRKLDRRCGKYEENEHVQLWRYDLDAKEPEVKGQPWTYPAGIWVGHLKYTRLVISQDKKQKMAEKRKATLSLTPEQRLEKKIADFSVECAKRLCQGSRSSEGELQEAKYRERIMQDIVPFLDGHASRLWTDVLKANPEYKILVMESIKQLTVDKHRLPLIRSEAGAKITGIDIDKDIADLREGHAALFAHLFTIDYSGLKSIEGISETIACRLRLGGQEEGSTNDELIRMLHLESLARMTAYSTGISSTGIDLLGCAARLGRGAGGESTEEIQAASRALMEFLLGPHSQLFEAGLKGCKKFVGKYGMEAAWEHAQEAVKRCSRGCLSSHQSLTHNCGEQYLYTTFIRMCKVETSPAMMRNSSMHAAIVGEDKFEEWEPRRYQVEFAKPALRGENSLIVAPSGSGKTMVAALVISDYLCRHPGGTEVNVIPSRIPGGKVVFVAQTMPLAIAQTRALIRFCPPSKLPGGDVGPPWKISAIGSMNAPLDWKAWDVIVCTPEFLENVIPNYQANPGGPSVGLIVIDEMQHTTYQQLLSKYHSAYTQIVGITSHMGNNLEGGLSTSNLSHLTNALMGTRVMSEDDLSPEALQELRSYAPKPEAIPIEVPEPAVELWFRRKILAIAGQITERKDAIEEPLIAEQGDEYVAKGEAAVLDHFLKKIKEAGRVAVEVGVREGLVFLADECLSPHWGHVEGVEDEYMSVKEIASWVYALIVLSGLFNDLSSDNEAAEVGDLDAIDADGYILPIPSAQQCEIVAQLHTLLDKSAVQTGSPRGEGFKCTLFLQTRVGVQRTLDLLTGQLAGRNLPHLASVVSCLRPRKLVGLGKHFGEAGAESYSAQQQTLIRFWEEGRGACNLLITTYSAMEGLDFPKCTAVICADSQSDTIAVQRMRRVCAEGTYIQLRSVEEQTRQSATRAALEPSAPTALKPSAATPAPTLSAPTPVGAEDPTPKACAPAPAPSPAVTPTATPLPVRAASPTSVGSGSGCSCAVTNVRRASSPTSVSADVRLSSAATQFREGGAFVRVQAGGRKKIMRVRSYAELLAGCAALLRAGGAACTVRLVEEDGGQYEVECQEDFEVVCAMAVSQGTRLFFVADASE